MHRNSVTPFTDTHVVAVPLAVAGECKASDVAHLPVAVPSHRPLGGLEEARQFLRREGFPRGLEDLVMQTKDSYPQRYWIVDNSGSMGIADGHRRSALDFTRQPCTRWEELRDTVDFHARLAALMGCPTQFRLLNAPLGGQQIVDVGSHAGAGSQAALDLVLATMQTDPTGRTPLCAHLSAIHDAVARDAEALRRSGKKAVVVIATDGVSTDGDLAAMLRKFERLPVWVVVRLCTDEDDVVDYWNNIDAEIEVDMDVLDDVVGEAKEVVAVNPWINYGVPLHRAREWGMHKKAFDLLDERLLSASEMGDFCRMLLGGDDLPRMHHPGRDWKAFSAALSAAQDGRPNGQTFDPLRKKFKAWINVRRLKGAYGRHAGCAIA